MSDFYSYFRRDTKLFPEAENTLSELCSRGIIIGTLSDVAYGMDNEFALEDIAPLLRYIKFPYTSVSQMMFVGDEQKDMECACNAGAVGVLIDRSGSAGAGAGDMKITDLYELTELI